VLQSITAFFTGGAAEEEDDLDSPRVPGLAAPVQPGHGGLAPPPPGASYGPAYGSGAAGDGRETEADIRSTVGTAPLPLTTAFQFQTARALTTAQAGEGRRSSLESDATLPMPAPDHTDRVKRPSWRPPPPIPPAPPRFPNVCAPGGRVTTAASTGHYNPGLTRGLAPLGGMGGSSGSFVMRPPRSTPAVATQPPIRTAAVNVRSAHGGYGRDPPPTPPGPTPPHSASRDGRTPSGPGGAVPLPEKGSSLGTGAGARKALARVRQRRAHQAKLDRARPDPVALPGDDGCVASPSVRQAACLSAGSVGSPGAFSAGAAGLARRRISTSRAQSMVRSGPEVVPQRSSTDTGSSQHRSRHRARGADVVVDLSDAHELEA